jgi:predicted NBD/HSP70 family sugar kinase
METRAENAAPAPTTIGIDIGKEVFHIVGFDADGKIAFRRKIKRLTLSDTFKKLPPCIVLRSM